MNAERITTKVADPTGITCPVLRVSESSAIHVSDTAERASRIPAFLSANTLTNPLKKIGSSPLHRMAPACPTRSTGSCPRAVRAEDGTDGKMRRHIDSRAIGLERLAWRRDQAWRSARGPLAPACRRAACDSARLHLLFEDPEGRRPMELPTVRLTAALPTYSSIEHPSVPTLFSWSCPHTPEEGL